MIREDPHRPALPVTADAYAHLPVFDDFARLTDPALYSPLPDGWVLGISDIVQSTAAIAAGRYKVVNTAAAAVIADVANALGGHDFPFVFGGDGASFALLATLGCGGCVCGANVLCRPRTVLDEALEFVRSGDTLVVTKLDHSAPSGSAPMHALIPSP